MSNEEDCAPSYYNPIVNQNLAGNFFFENQTLHGNIRMSYLVGFVGISGLNAYLFAKDNWQRVAKENEQRKFLGTSQQKADIQKAKTRLFFKGVKIYRIVLNCYKNINSRVSI